MCYLVLGQNSPLQINFIELHMEILMQQLLNNKQKYAVSQSFFMSKKLLH